MTGHILLSISRHRPSAQVAPLHCPILSGDSYNSNLSVSEVKHINLSILYPSVNMFRQVIGCSLKGELSQQH